jgi:hypothetical protein
MMLLVRSRVVARLLVVIVSLTLVAGCSGDDVESPGSGKTSSALPSQEELAAYFGAVAGVDVDGLADAEEIAADGSPAQDYARYEGAYAAASVAGGQPLPPAVAEPVDGGFEACVDAGEGEECATWADLVGQDGRLSEFTVNGTAVDDLLVPLSDQAPISPDGLFTAQPTFAYRSTPSQVLFVLVSVTSTDIPLEVQSRRAIYVEQAQALTGADSRGPTTIEPGGTQTVILAFPGAADIALDGQVTFDVTVGGEPQSVGFGLTDPGA